MQASWIAVVVTSPIVRAAINMMVRFGTTKAHLRMFTSETEALAWLESQSAVGR